MASFPDQVQSWFLLTEMHFADLLDWRILSTIHPKKKFSLGSLCFYITQHKIQFSISFSLEFTSQTVAIMEANEKLERGFYKSWSQHQTLIHMKNEKGQTSKPLLVMVIVSIFLPSFLNSPPIHTREKVQLCSMFVHIKF